MSSLVRGLQIMGEIGEVGQLTVEQLARRVNLPLSTTYRYVSTLKQLGFLSEYDGRYGAGPRLLQLVRHTDVNQALARLSDPLLAHLVYQTGETAILTVRVGSMAYCLHSIEPRRSVKLSFVPGTTLPMYAGASAKPLLAHAEPGLVDNLIESGLVRFTPQTPDPETLRQQLADIRRTGVCVTLSEVDRESIGVGVAVFWGGTVAAALSVAGVSSRFDRAKLQRTVDMVRAAGLALSEVLKGTVDAYTAANRLDLAPLASAPAGAPARPR
jgi:DNA-binding IclR family transcriptional regulator